MSHHHTHPHGHSPQIENINKAFVTGIVLNLAFVVTEAFTGIVTGSLSLLSDAGHNLADVGTLVLSLLGFRLLKIRANDKYTYGYRKTSVLATLFNAVILLVSIGAIAYEAVQRFLDPRPLDGITIAIVAGIGIVINTFTALLFFAEKSRDINIKGAYFHLMSDALVSLVIVIGGIIIQYTEWYWIDPALSMLVVVFILYITWGLLRDSLRLSLDGVPSDIDISDIRSSALKIKGIRSLHHIHIWAISTRENALTAHIVLYEGTTIEEEQRIKSELKHQLEHQQIHHITLETERESEGCKSEDC